MSKKNDLPHLLKTSFIKKGLDLMLNKKYNK